MKLLAKTISLGATLSLVPATNNSILMVCLLSITIITIIKF